MQSRLTTQGIRLGIAAILASCASQVLAETYDYEGVTTLCTSTCDGFAALTAPPDGSLLDGSIDIDVGASDTFVFADVGAFSFTVTSPTAPLEPYDGTNPTTANPLPVDSSVAVIEPMNTAGTFVTGGATDADGELASGILLFRFTLPPFDSNDAWVIIDVGTGEARVCLFFDTSGCIAGATESVVIDGSFALRGTLTEYSQDLEDLDIGDPGALTADGWKVFGNVFDSGSNFLFGYGPFGAPNGGSAFSAVVSGEGGTTQGDQQLSIYNDYECCQPSNGHFNVTDLVESNVFQEQTIGLKHVGETWAFSFDAKIGDLTSPTTALAFIKTLDPNAGFALTNFITEDMTSIGSTWNRYTLSITIDASLVGQLLQFGYASTASNFTSSGVFYDNLVFGPPDTDSDGVIDDLDNCTNVANAGQQDADGDGHGNICDADFNQSCGPTNFGDLALMQAGFFSINAVLDMNSSGGPVNFADLALFQAELFTPPGPSAPGALCN